MRHYQSAFMDVHQDSVKVEYRELDGGTRTLMVTGLEDRGHDTRITLFLKDDACPWAFVDMIRGAVEKTLRPLEGSDA